MIARIAQFPTDNQSHVHVSPRSPRGKFQRKPQNRPRLLEERDKKIKPRANEFVGFYSPKHQQNLQSALDIYQSNNLDGFQARTLKSQRSLTHLRKLDCSITRIEQNQSNNKENSASNSSEKSMNHRRISRLQLELKAITYENSRLKTENKTLSDQNQSLKAQVLAFTESFGVRMTSQSKPSPKLEANEKINKLTSTIQNLEMELKSARQKLFDEERIKKSRHNLEFYIESLEGINTEQREEIFKLDKLNKYLEIQLRTLKKQRVIGEANKKLQNQYLQTEADNKRLRRMVLDLQARLKSTMLFELTPDVSEKSESFLLD